MKILTIDTSCDETCAAVTERLKIHSNIIWSQASLHSKFGGVYPSLAMREHQKKIDFVVNKALSFAKCRMSDINAVSVTVGPGLAIALGVGINKARDLSETYHKPLIAVNHLEGHLLSPFALSNKSSVPVVNNIFPAYGLIVSGGNSVFVLIKEIGKYEILAETHDDALGESLDKAARMLGLGYPGGAVLEKFAKLGNSNIYTLPIPLLGQEDRAIFSYSGLKTSFFRLIEKMGSNLTKMQVYDLAASYQNVSFEHLIRVVSKIISYNKYPARNLFVGGGVAANVELRRRIRNMSRKFGITPLFPYSKRLYGDNAAIIGVAAYFKYLKKDFIKADLIDRLPNLKINQKI